VLVFAEDGDTCSALGTLFAGPLGCRVYQAERFDAALELYATTRVHVVVIAVTNREEGLRHLRAFLGPDHSRRAPIVVTVRSAQGGEHLEFLHAGADDAVPFLCSDAELLARVGRRLDAEREREHQAMARRYSLAGDLTGLGLTDLITVLEQSSATGSLELLTRRGAAQLLIRDGQMRYAAFGNTRGRTAFFELLREREGQFEFTQGEWEPPDENGALEGPNTALLLEGSQVVDEDPDGAPIVVARRSEHERPRPAPALRPDAGLAAAWMNELANPDARGTMRLLGRDQVRDWTSAHPDGRRLRLALVTDVTCGIQVVSHLAAPLALEETANSLRRPPAALGFTWSEPAGGSLEVLLLDQERLRPIVDVMLGAPVVMILAPSYGDFLTYNVTSRSMLQRLLRDVPPLAILGVGNQALEGQLGTFLKLAKLEFPTRFLRGSLWKLEVTPRTLIEEAIRQWASLADRDAQAA
jgi:DNA-binding response OmpR family regulator